MKKVFILSDYTNFLKELTRQMGVSDECIISLPFFINESDWHDWTTKVFNDNSIDKLIIPLSIPTDNPINTEGLKIALHIRLNYELALPQRLVPIVLLSDFNFEHVLNKIIPEFRNDNFYSDNNPENLLLTKGIYLSSFDKEDIAKTLKKAESCPSVDYQKQVLNKLKIFPKANAGTHSNTNAWGCFKLAQVTGLSDHVLKNDAIASRLKSLYSKHLICCNNAYTTEKRIDLNSLKCNKKKILFIDDQSDEGWGYLMKNIFKTADENFVFIDSSKYKNKETKNFHNFEGFLSECRLHIGKDWDLIIVDLRLYPEKEDIDSETITPTDFFGYKLIDEFLSNNEGYQIIVSTASNKIWNINAALERGAVSYYVKESPEFNYSISETNKHFENLKKTILKCFERSYLREIHDEIKDVKANLYKTSYKEAFINELINQLDLSFIMLKTASKNDIKARKCPSSEKTAEEKQFAFAYISLCLIIELINKEFFEMCPDGRWKIKGHNELLFAWSRYKKEVHPFRLVIDKKTKAAILDENGNQLKECFALGQGVSEWQKISGLIFQKWSLTDHKFVMQLSLFIQKRNGFVHSEKDILDKLDKGNYLHHDIYTPNGYILLFNYIKEIIKQLCISSA